MPTTPLADELPHRQEDRDRQPGSSPRDEPRNSDTLEAGLRTDSDRPPDIAPYYPQDQDINFEGSER